VRPEDVQDAISRYQERHRKHGYSPLALGWGKVSKQDIRFAVMVQSGIGSHSSVLDVGCGFGDLDAYLRAQGWRGRYVGVDIVDSLLEEARRQHPGIDVRNNDILTNPLREKFDYVVCSGIFGWVLKEQDNYDYIAEMLRSMFDHAQVAVSADFMSSYVDFVQPGAFHADPAKVLQLARQLSRRVAVRHDYLPFEFAMHIYKGNAIDPQRTTFAVPHPVQPQRFSGAAD
jgi:SAM-dependent methyltransferase